MDVSSLESTPTEVRTKRKLRILACPSNHGGCSYYRILMPLKKLEEKFPDEVEIRWDDNPLAWDKEKQTTTPPDFQYENFKWADIVFTQNIHNFGGVYTIEILRQGHQHGCMTHFDTDDLLTDLYKGHRMYDLYKDKNLAELTKYVYNNVDLVTVTQAKFAERIRPYVRGCLAIIKNAIDFDLDCWNNPRIEAPGITRFGWAGGIHHDVDVKQFRGVPHLVNQKVGKEKVHWGFYGRPMPPIVDGKPDWNEWQQDVWRGYEKNLALGMNGKKHSNYQIFTAQPPDKYGVFYSNMDVALAFLEPNEFNDSKSEIKLAEAGRYGVPLVATDVGCYDEHIVNGLNGYLIPKENRSKDWVRVLSNLAKNPKKVKEMGENLRQYCNTMFDINKLVGGRLHLYKTILEHKSQIPTQQEEVTS